MTTTAPLSETAIANMAIDILDDDPIADLTTDTTVGRWMARNFGRVRDEILQAYPWHQVRTRASLASSPLTDDDFGWDYKYAVPVDCLWLLPLRCNGELNGTPIPYELESGFILTDAPAPLKIRYIRRESNVAKFSPLMARVLAATLAWYASLSITGKSSYTDKAKSMLDSALEKARLQDTLESGTPEDQYDHDILSVRGVGL